MDKATQERVEKLLKKWNDAQAYLKSSELITEAAPVSAINEFRYAGRAFVDALLMARGIPDTFSMQDETYTKDFLSALAVTEQYVDNALHDISDVMVYFYVSSLNALMDRYGFQSTIGQDDDLTHALNDIEEAKRLIVESRQDRRKREKNYADVRVIVERMSNVYPKIQQGDLLQLIEEKRKKKRTMVVSAAIGLCGLVVGYLISYITP